MKLRLTLIPLAVLVGGLALPPSVSAQATAAATGPDTVVFAAKRGNVVFTHGKHAQAAECVACHHESKPEKPLESEYQKCSACHTDPATPPVTTTARSAMHDTVEKTGTCYNCHTKEAAAGKAVPMKCADCHQRDS